MVHSSVGRAIVSGADKRSYVRDMFTAIAPHYDFLNHLLSLNVDRTWRRAAVAQVGWQRVPRGTYLDLCAGTMDLAALLSHERGFEGRVVGADFVVPMLKRGRAKAPSLLAVGADALDLPFVEASFDGAMVGFGVRNLVDLDAGFREVARMLKPEARLVVLEFTTPRFAPLRSAYLFYFRRILPIVGRIASRHSTAYTYLPESVLAFPSPDELSRRMRAGGFDNVQYRLLTGGVAALHWGVKARAI